MGLEREVAAVLAVPSVGNYFDVAKLSNVFIKCYVLIILHSLNDNIDDTIFEAPVLVSELGFCFPSCLHISRFDPNQVCESSGQELWPNQQRSLIGIARFKERQRFVNDKISGDEQLMAIVKVAAGRSIEFIFRRMISEPRASIYEDHSD